MTRLRQVVANTPADAEWEVLPFRFDRLDDGRMVMTNMVGEPLVLTIEEFGALREHQALSPDLWRRLAGRHMIRTPGDELPIELLAMKARTRYRRLADFTALHMFVVTLRCDHSCHYCQVSRQGSRKHEYDMSSDTAQRALDFVFRSPAPAVKIEFQGGEPLLNFERIEEIVWSAEARNVLADKDLAFVIATNLALVNDHIIEFCREHNIHISTSLDGPAMLHNANRPRPGGDSWQRTVAGIRRVQAKVGSDSVSALMTTTEASLPQVKEILDTYVSLGLRDVFLRPISPYGFAVKQGGASKYDVAAWLAFYERGLRYILELNANGVPIVESYAALILKKMLTNDDPSYLDLRSPAGLGIGGIVYNFDGDIYAADEGRMLAEMGDKTFRIGNLLESSYEEVMLSDALLDPLEQSFAYSAPMCNDCAFEPFCGADPLYHHAIFGDPLGRKPLSGFCTRNQGVFRLLLELYTDDPAARQLFRKWANR